MATSTAEGLDAVLDTLRVVIGSLLYARDVLPLKAYENLRLGTESPLFFFHPIKPGSSKRADFLLNWLEDPITQAIDRGVLKAFQICIHPDSTRRSKVVETYTFSVRKTSREDTIKPQRGDGTSNAVGKYPHLWPIINEIQGAGGRAPAMARKFLTVNLFFEDDNTDLRWLKGFDKSTVKNCAFPQAGGWQKKTEVFPVMSVGGHDITVTMSYMQGSELAHDKLEVKREFAAYNTQAKFADDLFRAIPASMSATQDGIANGIGAGLRDLTSPRQPTQGDTQSMNASMPYTVPTHSEATNAAPHDCQLVFNENEIFVNRRGKLPMKQQALDVAKLIGNKWKGGRYILCICAHNNEEGHMVECECCGTWQHLHCHGYVNVDDPRRTDKHYCYMCYSNPAATHVAEDLMVLAGFRRAMFNILQHGMGTKGDFASVMQLEIKDSNKIFERLKNDNHIAAAQGSHRAGYAATGLPHYVPVKGALFNTTLDKFFDPTKHVREFFERPKYRPSQLVDYLHFPPEDDKLARVEAAVPPQQRKAAAAVTTPTRFSIGEEIRQKRALEENFKQAVDTPDSKRSRKSGRNEDAAVTIYQTTRIISALRND